MVCGLVVIYSLLGFIFHCKAAVSIARMANCCLILGYLVMVFWLIAGTVLRFDAPGRTCSGEFWEDRDEDYFNYDRPWTTIVEKLSHMDV